MIKESQIQSAILEYLGAMGLTFWRCNLGGIRIAGARRGKNPMKGFPDIGIIVPGSGKLMGIEVKKPGGTMSPEQLLWRDKLTKSGAIYVVATSVEDVRVALSLHQPRQDEANRYEISNFYMSKIPFQYRGRGAS